MAPTNHNYQLHRTARLLKDAASVKFHVDNNDYFGTAATLVRLLQQQWREGIKKAPAAEMALIEQAFKNLENDLLLLQKNYHIKANTRKTKIDPKGKLNNQ